MTEKILEAAGEIHNLESRNEMMKVYCLFVVVVDII